MAIHLEPPMPTIRVQPPTGFSRLDRGLVAFRRLFSSLGANDLNDHVERVLSVALRNRIIEPDRFETNSKPPEINERLLYEIGCHQLDQRALSRVNRHLPQAVRKYEKIRRQLKVLGELRDLDLEAAPLSMYAAILNRPPEALLARLADIGEYHDPEWRRQVDKGKHSALFDSKMTAHQEQRKIARIGRLLYAPLADFLGYRKLSGEILEVAAITLFRDSFSDVVSQLNELQAHHSSTAVLAHGIAKKIDEFCEQEDIKVDIIFRTEKSMGKIVEKVRYHQSPHNGGRPDFSVRDLHDLLAFKVIIKDPRGKKLTEEEKLALVYRIKSFVEDEIYAKTSLKDLTPDQDTLDMSLKGYGTRLEVQDYFKIKKANGYSSIHLDFIIPRGEFVNFEIQINTEESDFWARRGGAAHFVYNAETYGGTDALRVFNTVWAQMMDALKTGRDDVVAKLLVPSFKLSVVDLVVRSTTGRQMYRGRIGIPSNRLVADLLVKAGIDITSGAITVPNKPDYRLDRPLNNLDELEAVYDPRVQLSARFATSMLSRCSEVQTAVLLSKYLAEYTPLP
ncbi:hypothetical protein J4450_07685 [Candidatus Micrarchaeota archaeon]|nr:hypothetical protein [Candidatus Micrarchaeota archaeon]